MVEPLGSADRRRIMESVALVSGPRWRVDFIVMLSLSVVVAALGLMSNSVAVVIGAMLLAPLMTPVLGVAAAIAMALQKKLLVSLGRVGLGVVVAIGLSALLSLLVPGALLTDEMLARTSPGFADLLIALAAGAAGAYAVVRPEVSDSVPGVAVAVALVPPLATVGICLQSGHPELAKGAALLFLANFAAIVLAGVGVFLGHGLAPKAWFEHRRRQVLLGAGAALAVTAAVAVPLVSASAGAYEEQSRRASVSDAVDRWLDGTDMEVDDLTVSEGKVVVWLAGPEPPPAIEPLANELVGIYSTPPKLDVRWFQSTEGDADAAGADGADRIADQESAIREAVANWMGPDSGTYDIDGVSVVDDQLVIELRSAEPPPSVDGLVDQLSTLAGEPVSVKVDWSRQLSLSSTGTSDTELFKTRQRVAEIAREWSTDGANPEVALVTVDGNGVTIDLVGAESGDIEGLRRLVQSAIGNDAEVRIFITPRREIPPDG